MGAFLGISARTPTKYSLIGSLLALCDQSPFARQLVVNFLGPVFYELLTMMAVPSEEVATPSTAAAAGLDATIVRFLCFVYLEAMQFEATEDVFEALTFTDQCQVAELQEFCAKSLKSLAQERHFEWNRVQSWRTGGLGKRLCDYALLFIGGRMPFYFDEEELALMQSVVLETILDVAYSQRSEFDMAETGLMWLQRKVICGSPQKGNTSGCPAIVGGVANSRDKNFANFYFIALLFWVAVVAVCSVAANIFAGEIDATHSEWQKFLDCSLIIAGPPLAIWTWISSGAWMTMRLKLRPTLLLYLMNLDGDALESIIAVRQRRIAIIHYEKGS